MGEIICFSFNTQETDAYSRNKVVKQYKSSSLCTVYFSVINELLAY
jgi:hypothetical protein